MRNIEMSLVQGGLLEAHANEVVGGLLEAHGELGRRDEVFPLARLDALHHAEVEAEQREPRLRVPVRNVPLLQMVLDREA